MDPKALQDPLFDEDLGDVPEFANDFNKALAQQIREKQKFSQQHDLEIEENTDRINVISEHLRNVRQELQNTQQLQDAKQKELETESHMLQLALRESGRLTAEMQKGEKQLADIQDKVNLVQNNIFRANEKMDHFKLQMNWNQEELEQWALAAKQKEEDNLALLKYKRQDEVVIKELNLQIEKVAHEVQSKKGELEHEITETQAAQIELDKTAEDFRNLHRERQELLKQWGDALEAMQRRDKEIKLAGERFAEQKQIINEKQAALNEKNQFVETLKSDNKETEVKISAAERNLAKVRKDHASASLGIGDFEDECEVLKNTLGKAANEMAVARQNNASLEDQIETKKKRLERDQNRLESTRQKLENEFAQTDDLEKRAKQVEELHRQEEQHLRVCERELVDLKDSMFKQSQELFKLRKKEANIIGEISGAQAQNKNLSGQVHKLDQESLKQKELIYNAEFQIQQLERKVSRAQGVRSDEESKKLNARIQELTSVLEERMVQHGMLTDQLKKLHDDIRSAKRRLADTIKEREKLEGRIGELTLENDTRQKNLKQAVKEKEDVLVQHDVLKLEVTRLRETLNNRADEVFGLENRKFQLKMTMDEREKEIQIHLDALQSKVRATEDERHKAAMELNEQLIKVEKLKRKYESIVTRSPEDGEEESQVFKVIKAAQEREELQRKGDKLDAQIRKAEKEIFALESTLRHLTQRNAAYRDSFSKADQGSEDYTMKAELERQYQDSMRIVQQKKRRMEELQEDLRHREAELSAVRDEHASLQKRGGQLENAATQANKAEEEQRIKVERAHKQLNKLRKEHKRAYSITEKEETLQERDFKAKEMKEKNRNTLQRLAEYAQAHPDLYQILENALQQEGVQLPQTGVDEGGRPRSARSDRSRASQSSFGSLGSNSSRSSVNSSASSRRSVNVVDIGGGLGRK